MYRISCARWSIVVVVHSHSAGGVRSLQVIVGRGTHKPHNYNQGESHIIALSVSGLWVGVDAFLGASLKLNVINVENWSAEQ